MKTCSRYQYWSISHDLGGIAYVYQLKGHESRLGRDCLCHWKNTSYDLILLIVDRLMKMVHYEPVQITINAPALAAGYTPSTCPLQGRPYPPFQIQVGIS